MPRGVWKKKPPAATVYQPIRVEDGGPEGRQMRSRILTGRHIDEVLATANDATATKKFTFEDARTAKLFSANLQQHFIQNYPRLMCHIRHMKHILIAWVEPRHPLTQRSSYGVPKPKRTPPRRQRQP